MNLTPTTLRLDTKGRPCGQSHIPANHTCRKQGSFPTRKAIAAGLGVAALGVGAYALSRRPKQAAPPSTISIPTQPRLPGSKQADLPRLPGVTPRALLAAAPARKSKTQRMRENTAAAMRQAESRIGQTAREEVRRVAQIGNTMAAAGEASGMATKTAFREVRLRVEAARRRYEPGYRRGGRPTPKAPSQLPESANPVFRNPFTASAPLTPESVSIDPRTGQPRRSKPKGFGRSTRDRGMTFYDTQYIDPARQGEVLPGKSPAR